MRRTIIAAILAIVMGWATVACGPDTNTDTDGVTITVM